VAIVAAAVLCAGGGIAACVPHGRRAPDLPAAGGSLAPAERHDHIDTLTREPMVAEHPGGTLFVAGYNRRRPGLWKSVDGGATWARVDVGTESQGAVGNSDVDLAIAPDGALYFVSMTYDNAVHEGRQVAVGVSGDTGATWRWTTVSRTRFDDRPWVAVAPDGTAHLIWNDGRGVSHARSRDGGRTWDRTGRIHDRGGSSHLAIGPRGEMAARVGPGAASGTQCDEDTDLVAVSTDGGDSWRKYPAPGAPRSAGCDGHPDEIPRWVDPLAWDSTGALYALWTDSAGVWLARSADMGATWTPRRVIARADGEPVSYFPYLAARGRGTLGATWLTGAAEGMRWRAAWIEGADRPSPHVRLSPPMPLESWRGDPPRADAGGEYLAARWLSDGSLAVVTPIQHESAGRLGFTLWTFRDR
jgi:hypothetical protein